MGRIGNKKGLTMGMSPGNHYWGCYGNLPCSQVYVTHLKIRHLGVLALQMSYIDLTLRTIGHLVESSPSNGHQGDIPYLTDKCRSHGSLG